MIKMQRIQTYGGTFPRQLKSSISSAGRKSCQVGCCSYLYNATDGRSTERVGRMGAGVQSDAWFGSVKAASALTEQHYKLCFRLKQSMDYFPKIYRNSF
jgi:hypothetical protein